MKYKIKKTGEFYTESFKDVITWVMELKSFDTSFGIKEMRGYLVSNSQVQAIINVKSTGSLYPIEFLDDVQLVGLSFGSLAILLEDEDWQYSRQTEIITLHRGDASTVNIKRESETEDAFYLRVALENSLLISV